MDKEFLLAMLQLKQAIDNKDKKNVDVIIDKLNNLKISDDDDSMAYLRDYFLNLKNVDMTMMEDIINRLDVIDDKDALLVYIRLSNGFSNITTKQVKDVLEKDYRFKRNRDTIALYGLIAQAVIFLDDPEVLQLTIDKLQSLEE